MTDIAEPAYTPRDEARDRARDAREQAAYEAHRAPEAVSAKSCDCEVPWIERDEFGAHCFGCGRDYGP